MVQNVTKCSYTLHLSSCVNLIEMWMRKFTLYCVVPNYIWVNSWWFGQFKWMKTEQSKYTTWRKQSSSFVKVLSLDLAIINFILVYLFFTLNRFHILFSCFHCWLLMGKCSPWNVLFWEVNFNFQIYYVLFKPKFTLIICFSNWESTINGTLKLKKKKKKKKNRRKYCEKCLMPTLSRY